jgi:hypothetical protein
MVVSKMMMMNVKVTKHGPFFSQSSLFPGKLQLISQAIAKVVEDAAIEDYKHKKISKPTLPSLIVSSIGFDIRESNNFIARSIVFAGGPSNDNPEYAKYVNDGHTYKNGKSFTGHHFMQVGANAGNEQKMIITNRILNLK